ncbi:MAG: ATP-binding protein [Caldilineaceae bacterium]|nr:ATP-binding protein [Caldilineaceae bacterium]
MSLILNRYPLNYRAALVTELMTVVQHGDSACLVGLAGVGKSNLARFLEAPEVAQRSLPASEAARIHFRRIDCSPNIDRAQLYEHMAEVVRILIHQAGMQGGLSADSDAIPFFRLRQLLKHLCDKHQQRIVFIFDEFESMVRHQEAQFLQDLRTLRDDHRTTRNVAFLVITHRMPQLIGGQPGLGKQSKFFEIIRDHIYALPPYKRSDTDSMIDALVRRRGGAFSAIDPNHLDLLWEFSGGHSGLLAALFNELYHTFSKSIYTLLKIVHHPSEIQSACEKIVDYLHAEEVEALRALVLNQPVSPEMLLFLRKRGLIRYESAPVIFSPLFAEYVRHQFDLVKK